MYISHYAFLINDLLFAVYFIYILDYGNVWMWEYSCMDVRVLMYRCESWTIKKVDLWRTDAFELWCWRRLLRVPWSTMRSNQSILKEKPWIFIESTDAEAPILWPPDVKSWVTGKDLSDGKDWGQEEKWVTEDEVVGWHHQLNGHEFEQTPGDGEGQGNLACCSPWRHKESDTEQLNNKGSVRKKANASHFLIKVQNGS